MAIKNILEIEAGQKNILVRVDYNVDLKLLETTGEHFKIAVSRKTIDFLCERGSKVALLTHIGNPQERDPAFSTERLRGSVEKILNRPVRFVSDCLGPAVAEALERLAPGEVLLLENVRYYPEEEKNDADFAQQLARPFDVYVNEAFGVNHRSHASVAALAKILPAYCGFRLAEEIAELDRIRLRPEHPAVAIIGGAKIETKLPLIQALELNYDYILVGGKIANEALDRKEAFSDKVHLPVDFDSEERYDIGPKTIVEYQAIIAQAKTVIWNGPLGKFEDPEHAHGTESILASVVESYAFTVMGGGESLDILEKDRSQEKINFVSTGGGAMLEYLSGKILPGILALEKSRHA